jgi:hypothetical protein
MAYSTSNPPVLVRQDIGNQGSSVWALSGTDSAATVDTTGYITNGGALGMKVNDRIGHDQHRLIRRKPDPERGASAPRLLFRSPNRKRPMQHLHANAFQLAEGFARNSWRVTLDEETPYERLFEREFWSHVASQLGRGDIIEVTDEKISFGAILIVRACDRLWAVVGEISRNDFDAPVAVEDAPLIIQWKGPKLRFCVVRTTDNERVKEGFQVKEDAETWSREHLKALAA